MSRFEELADLACRPWYLDRFIRYRREIYEDDGLLTVQPVPSTTSVHYPASSSPTKDVSRQAGEAIAHVPTTTALATGIF